MLSTGPEILPVYHGRVKRSIPNEACEPATSDDDFQFGLSQCWTADQWLNHGVISLQQNVQKRKRNKAITKKLGSNSYYLDWWQVNQTTTTTEHFCNFLVAVHQLLTLASASSALATSCAKTYPHEFHESSLTIPLKYCVHTYIKAFF